MEPSKSLPNRHEIAKKISESAEHLDILFRKSDGRGPFNIPFMRWVAKETGSQMTHAAMLWRRNDFKGVAFDTVLELSDVGFRVYRVVDWLDFCIDGEFEVHRVPMSEDVKAKVIEGAESLLALDAYYDKTFSTGWYCTKLVCKIYEAGGIYLQKPKTLREICGWLKGHRISIINKFIVWWTNGEYGLPVDTPLYFVGNKTNGGMAAYPGLKRIL